MGILTILLTHPCQNQAKMGQPLLVLADDTFFRTYSDKRWAPRRKFAQRVYESGRRCAEVEAEGAIGKTDRGRKHHL